MKQTVCDKCGKIIDDLVHYQLHCEQVDKVGWASKSKQIDLCNECFHDICDIIEGNCKERGEQGK